MSEIDVPAILEEAASFLTEHEWCQGYYVLGRDYGEDERPGIAHQLLAQHRDDPTCSVCALGACLAVATEPVAVGDVIAIVEDAWTRVAGVGPVTFNDSRAASKEEVVDEMRRVAAALREEQA